MSDQTLFSPTEFRAAGTDLSERRRSGVSRGAIVDIDATSAMTEITWDQRGAAHIGAFVTIAAIAADARIALNYPALSAAAAGLATPQIRNVATLGGNLAQRSRCWYYRNPHVACLKKGGPTCPARDGNHLYGVAFDLGPCVTPHASTMTAALLSYDGTIVTTSRPMLQMRNFLGDGSSAQDNSLVPEELITAIQMPPPVPEAGFYKRAISRTHAEWPLVELVTRVSIADGKVLTASLVAGGIAPVPLRLSGAEKALQGSAITASTIGDACSAAVATAKPLPMTAYKLQLLRGLMHDVLGKLQGSPATTPSSE